MTEKATNSAKKRQKPSGTGCDLVAQRSQLATQHPKNGCNPAQTQETKGESTASGLRVSTEPAHQRLQPGNTFLSAKNTSSLLRISSQAVRDSAAAGKYAGAFKTPTNGGEGWAIPLDSLPAEAQALYWHEQFTTAGRTADLFEGGSSFTPEESDEHWKRYELATEKCQGRARVAFAALIRFNELLRHGTKKMAAYAAVMSEFDVVRSTFNLWQKSVDGLKQGDWLPALVPDFSGRTNARRSEWPEQAWLFFLRDVCTPGRPLKTAYNRTVREAEAKGWGKLPSLQTARRDFDNLDAAVIAVLREGDTALKRLSPTVRRDYTAFALHDQWSMDGRRMDLMVRDSKGEFGPKGRTFRLWLYAIEDMRSRYLVGYAIGAALNADLVRAALMDAFKKTGRIVPKYIQIDNGMEAAAKEITGGAPWRRRGKVKEDEIIGVLPLLGIEVPWAMPGHGQTKPIERLFGTLARMCETRPEFKGAYCGNTPEARPEEWDAGKAASIDLVRELFSEELGAYLRTPHRGDGMDGKSPMQTYTELMNAPGYVPRQISELQMRVCALSAVPITIQKDGSFIIHGARYYSVETASLPKGRGYYARYNRHDLADPVFVYRASKLVAENVRQIERTPGNSKEAAKNITKARADFTRAKKAQAKALLDIKNIDTPSEIAKRLADKHPELVDKKTGEILPVAKVVELTRSTAEVSREPSKTEADEATRIKAMAEEMSRMSTTTPRRVGGY